MSIDPKRLKLLKDYITQTQDRHWSVIHDSVSVAEMLAELAEELIKSQEFVLPSIDAINWSQVEKELKDQGYDPEKVVTAAALSMEAWSALSETERKAAYEYPDLNITASEVGFTPSTEISGGKLRIDLELDNTRGSMWLSEDMWNHIGVETGWSISDPSVRLESSFKKIQQLTNPDLMLIANQFLNYLERFLTSKPDLLPNINLSVLDDSDNITFEWTLKDRRLGWVISVNENDSGWYFVSKTNSQGGPFGSFEEEVQRMQLLSPDPEKYGRITALGEPCCGVISQPALPPQYDVIEQDGGWGIYCEDNHMITLHVSYKEACESAWGCWKCDLGPEWEAYLRSLGVISV